MRRVFAWRILLNTNQLHWHALVLFLRTVKENTRWSKTGEFTTLTKWNGTAVDAVRLQRSPRPDANPSWRRDCNEDYASAQEELAGTVSYANRRAEVQVWELIRN